MGFIHSVNCVEYYVDLLLCTIAVACLLQRSIAAVDSVDGLSPDAFHITIHLPHLHLQPAGIDKGNSFVYACVCV